MEQVRENSYARTHDGVYLAYQIVGDGPVDIVWSFDFVSNVDLVWEDPEWSSWFHGLASFARLILHDRRATGLSSRNVAPPNLETRVSDLEVVLDAVNAERPILAGFWEGGAPNIMFAATHPERVHSVVWYSPMGRSIWEPSYPWGWHAEDVEFETRSLAAWGTDAYADAWRQFESRYGRVVSEEEGRRMARLTRHTATPDVAKELSRIWYETDIRGLFGSVQASVLLVVDEGEQETMNEARYIASLLPTAVVQTLPPDGAVRDLASLARDFIGVAAPATTTETVLATILFTDIVASTETQSTMGDHAWKTIVEEHHRIVRATIRRWGGNEVDHAGDGFYATFGGPARAIRCAIEATEEVSQLGIQIRAGIHTGECEIINERIGGLAVSIGARVAAQAEPSEVLVSQTVKDLVAGSGFTFEDAGEHELRGVPDRWRLYRVLI